MRDKFRSLCVRRRWTVLNHSQVLLHFSFLLFLSLSPSFLFSSLTLHFKDIPGFNYECILTFIPNSLVTNPLHCLHYPFTPFHSWKKFYNCSVSILQQIFNNVKFLSLSNLLVIPVIPLVLLIKYFSIFFLFTKSFLKHKHSIPLTSNRLNLGKPTLWFT